MEAIIVAMIGAACCSKCVWLLSKPWHPWLVYLVRAAGRMKKQAAYLRVLIPFLLQTCVTTWKDATADPAFTAVVLAAFSMVQPSAAGAGAASGRCFLQSNLANA